jgi:hypothetical protein
MILGDWDIEKIHAGEKYIAEPNKRKTHTWSIRWKVLTIILVQLGHCDR